MDSILIDLQASGCKRETLAQVFSCELGKISKNTKFTEYLWTTASAFSFSEAATRGVLWKKVLLKISQNSWKNTCGLWNFKEHLFFTEHLWMTVSGFSLQLYKNWELATLLGKPQMNTLYLETLTLEVLLRYIIYIYIYFLSGFFLTVLFTFSMFFQSFSVLFYFVLLLLIKKDYFKLRID